MALFMWSRALILGGALASVSAASPAAGQVITTYAYDAQGQVRTVNHPTQTVTYAYDAAGNRVTLGASAPPSGAVVQTDASKSSASKGPQVDAQPLAQAGGSDFGLDDVIAATAYAWASAPGTSTSTSTPNNSPTPAGQAAQAAAPSSSR